MKKFLSASVIICLCVVSNAQNWLLTGNAGTTTGTNFIGTTDAKALMFKVNNQRSGFIDFSLVKGNTSLGFQALNNPTGNNNTAIGYQSMLAGTTASGNVALGFASMFRTTSGHHNVALGDSAFYDNTTGSLNTATGYLAMFRNISGSENTAYGYNTLHFNTSGAYNVAAGSYSSYNNTSGNYNTSTGSYAFTDNTIGSENCVFGYGALNHNTTASGNVAVGTRAMFVQSYSNGGVAYAAYNVAVGYEALYYNQPASTVLGIAGIYNTAIGSYALHSNTTGNNTAVGSFALYDNTTGSSNTAVGNNALEHNSINLENTAVGASALFFTTASDGNTAVGSEAGGLYNNGYYNVFVGTNTHANAGGYSNIVSIGNGTVCTASNQVTLGNGTTTSYRAFANWSNISDGRYKKNIKENVPGLQFINKLKPVTYTLDATAIDKFLHKNIPAGKNMSAEGKTINQKALKEKEQIRYTGFVAQDVEKAAKELNFDFSGVDAAKNENDLYGLRYADFVVPLVKAVQELSTANDAKDEAITEMKSEIGNLKSEIDELKKTIGSQVSGVSNTSTINTSLSTASLEQNIPNPFKGITTINCFIPVNNGNAYINFYSQSGSLLNSIKITGEGKNTIILNANELAAGIYKYTLVLDGKVVDSKMMMLQR